MAQAPFLGKERVGRVTIERFKDYLRLRWTVDKKTFCLSLGKDSGDMLKVARAKAALIESDLTFDRFDVTLEKYGKPKKTTLQLVSNDYQNDYQAEINLRELWDKFLEDKLPNCKAKTCKEYESFTKLLDKLGDKATYKALETKQALLNITTSDQTRRMLLYLNACCNWGVKYRLIQLNPYSGVATDIPRVSSTSHEPDAFSQEERDAVIQAFKSDKRGGRNYQPYAPLVEFWFFTGCRPSEAIGLTWGKIADDCSSVTFDGSYQIINGRHVWSKGSKNNKARTIAVSTSVQRLLQSIRPPDAGLEQLVFPSPDDGKPINYDNFTRRAWNAVVDPIKPNTTPYNCRDTFITTQLLKGVASAVIAKWCDTSTNMIDNNYADKLKLSQLRPTD